MINNLSVQAEAVMKELKEKAGLKPGDSVVIGCSTSEIIGSKIGSNSSPDVAKTVFEAIYEYAKKENLKLAFQCCEHLNRAIVIEKEDFPFAEAVNVVPQPKAGGSMATQAYAHFKNPVVVEEIKTDAGIDIGLTMIGMHLKSVAVPVRISLESIGNAPIVCARTRPKFIGGVRAAYNEDLL